MQLPVFALIKLDRNVILRPILHKHITRKQIKVKTEFYRILPDSLKTKTTVY